MHTCSLLVERFFLPFPPDSAFLCLSLSPLLLLLLRLPLLLLLRPREDREERGSSSHDNRVLNASLHDLLIEDTLVKYPLYVCVSVRGNESARRFNN